MCVSVHAHISGGVYVSGHTSVCCACVWAGAPSYLLRVVGVVKVVDGSGTRRFRKRIRTQVCLPVRESGSGEGVSAWRSGQYIASVITLNSPSSSTHLHPYHNLHLHMMYIRTCRVLMSTKNWFRRIVSEAISSDT